MKIYTSYFYQIRFFKPNMIPISTAVSDPVWYHGGTRNNGMVFLDKNNVINGLRIAPLAPGKTCSNLCRGRDACSVKNPDECNFLSEYYKQLSKIDFNTFMQDLNFHVNTVCKLFDIKDEPIAAFIVHEALDNPCSERVIIQRWFNDNGLSVTELNPREY